LRIRYHSFIFDRKCGKNNSADREKIIFRKVIIKNEKIRKALKYNLFFIFGL